MLPESVGVVIVGLLAVAVLVVAAFAAENSAHKRYMKRTELLNKEQWLRGERDASSDEFYRYMKTMEAANNEEFRKLRLDVELLAEWLGAKFVDQPVVNRPASRILLRKGDST